MWNAFRGYRLYLALITVAGLLLRALVPANIMWVSPHDDEASMRIADSLMHGDWLGAWGTQQISHITLAKGPGYPIFLALTHWTGVAPQNISYALYLLGALLLVLVLRRHTGAVVTVALYALLAWSPVAFAGDFSRIYRDQLVAALALLALGLAVQLAMTLAGDRYPTGSRRRWVMPCVQAALLGAVLGWLLITRTDVVWVITTVALVLLMGAAPAIWRSRPRTWVLSASSLVIVAVLAALPTLGVIAMNQRTYHVASVDDYYQGAFADSIKSWSSVPGGKTFLVVSHDQRAAVYAVSGTARLLEPVLEDPTSFWITHGCSFQVDTSIPCNEFGGSFAWALRDAAMATGQIHTALEFQQFFQKLDGEIGSACSHVFRCGPRALSPDVPSLDRISKRTVLAGFAGFAVGSLGGGANGWSQAGPSTSPSEMDLWLSTVNGARQSLGLVESGQHQPMLTQRSIVQVLGSIYAWWLIPAFLLSIVAFFTRALWASFVGRVAVACVLGWGMNLGIVSVFLASTNKLGGAGVALYTMPSQSFFLLATALATLVLAQEMWQRASRRLLSAAGEPALSPDSRTQGEEETR